MKTCKNLFIVLAAFALLWTACKPASTGAVTIVMVDNGYDSQKTHNALAALVIRHAFSGYDVEYSTASTTMNYESMKNGDIDVAVEIWTENFATYPADVKNGDIVNMGVIVEDSRQGLYVPRYVIEGDPGRGIAPMAPDLKRVGDLLKYPHVFPDDENPSMGRVYGAIPGWKADAILHKKYEYYGLDRRFNYLRLGSEAALFASLMSAYNLGLAWVGYCYEPTWIAGKLPLVLLEDAPFEPNAFQEGKTAFSTQRLMSVCNRGFPSKAPEIYEFLKKFRTGRQLISEALAYLDDTKATHDETAIWFVKNNDALVDEWLPAENAKRLRDYLSRL